MSTQQEGPPPFSRTPESRDSGKKLSLLFVGIAAGAILALVFVTAVLVLVLWKAGFFTSKSTTLQPVEYKDVKKPVSAGAPVLHIRSKTLNVLDGKPVIIENGGEVRSGDGYLVVSDSENLRITGEFTVSAWFQPRTIDRGMTIASRALNGPPWAFPFSSWLLRLNSESLLEGSLSDGHGYSPSTWSVSVQRGQWHHAVLTYDGTTKKMFLNGVRQQRLASGILNHPNGIGNAPGRSILIGADESESPAAEIFDGAIDDVRIFNRALPDEEVQVVFNEGAKRYGVNR
jgi:hypothetical protein